MKFSRSGKSAILRHLIVPAFALALVSSMALAAQTARKPSRANELSIAGLRPGHDSVEDAQKRLDSLLSPVKTENEGTRTWQESCTGRKIALESDEDGVIQNIDLSAGTAAANCKELQDAQHTRVWSTGHGLHLGDPRERVLAIYGRPGSSGPSMKDGRELELFYYAFDWAGSEVPQVMEISCDRATGRVVEILLAFPSL
jgi:hypothetical protein